tara:strand:+ start:2215 stop:2610 length:396 start_codon:yes stop_codon:yes gene_type:complete
MAKPRALPIDGFCVTRVAVDDSLTLFCRTADGQEAEIRIDGAFVLSDSAGNMSTGCVEDCPASAGPVLGLVLCNITAARITETGTLEIQFLDGHQMFAEAEDHFVSWEIKSSDGFHAVCLADKDVLVKDGA